jgi:peptide/nickel transport system substrate-binding protein
MLGRALSGTLHVLWIATVILSGHLAAVAQTKGEPVHGLAMHGAPLHPPTVTNFVAVNPDAPKGGRLLQGVQGSYDSVNPFIIRGVAAAGVRDNVTESLLARSLDEPFTLYGLIAQSVELPSDRSQVTFNLDPRARFSDGHPITADDIIFSFNALKEKGRPNHRAYFKKISEVVRVTDRKVRFVFADGGDRELPLILGLMPVLPAHLLTNETFDQTTLEPFIGSGPYKMARIDPGRTIVYERDPNYWGRDLPVNRGRFNVDELRFDYYRDNNVMFEALKNGELDVRFEDDPALWSQGYDFAAVRDGRIVKIELETFQPAGMSALVFNTRRPLFANAKVRQALVQMFDFEFANRSLFNGLYKRTQSFFERSMLSSAGRPADAEELRLLAPFASAVRPGILDGTARLPETDGTGRNRANLGKALALMTEAGFVTVDGKLIDPATQRPMAFEILVGSLQKVLPSFVADLARIGITATIRQVDQAQFQARLRIYDYDMIPNFWPSSLSPGNEQTFRWSGKVGKEEGSFNFVGVDNPGVDAMIDAMLAATTPEAFTSAVRALDRLLRSGDYVIPLYHVPKLWVAHARRIKYPARLPLAGLAIDTWWVDKN